jgi:hypothetical protein
VEVMPYVIGVAGLVFFVTDASAVPQRRPD